MNEINAMRIYAAIDMDAGRENTAMERFPLRGWERPSNGSGAMR